MNAMQITSAQNLAVIYDVPITYDVSHIIYNHYHTIYNGAVDQVTFNGTHWEHNISWPTNEFALWIAGITEYYDPIFEILSLAYNLAFWQSICIMRINDSPYDNSVKNQLIDWVFEKQIINLVLSEEIIGMGMASYIRKHQEG